VQEEGYEEEGFLGITHSLSESWS